MPTLITESSDRERVIDSVRAFFEHRGSAKPFVAGETYIGATAKSVCSLDLENMVHAVLDMNFTAGRFAHQFEKQLPRYLGKNVAASLVNSGSSANLIAVSTLTSPLLKQFDQRPLVAGDEVITVAAGFPTTVNPLIQNQLVPVFVDVNLDTLNASPEDLEKARSPKTRAVMLAHTLGNPFQADVISSWCRDHNLYLIEDCSDALGSEFKGAPVGSFGDLATLSFYPAHHITTGEGGAVFTLDNRWRKVAESLRDWGRDCWCETGKDNTCQKRFDWQLGDLPEGYDHKYIYSQIGYNLKMTDMQAALGLSQLAKLDQFTCARRKHWQVLRLGIEASPLLDRNFQIVQATPESQPSWFGFALHCRESVDRRKLMKYLEDHKVGSRVLFGGDLTRQPAYRNVNYRVSGALAHTAAITKNTFWLGVHPQLTRAHLNYILEQLEAAVREQGAT